MDKHYVFIKPLTIKERIMPPITLDSIEKINKREPVNNYCSYFNPSIDLTDIKQELNNIYGKKIFDEAVKESTQITKLTENEKRYMDYDIDGLIKACNYMKKQEDTKTMVLRRGNKIMPIIKKIIFNKPATIVFWSDKTKTVVKADLTRDIWDPEKGLAMAFCKKFLGNDRHYYDLFKPYEKEFIEISACVKTSEYDSIIEDTFVEVSDRFIKLILENIPYPQIKNIVSVDDIYEPKNDEPTYYFIMKINDPINHLADSYEISLYNDMVRWSPTLNGSDYDWHDLNVSKGARIILMTIYKNWEAKNKRKSEDTNMNGYEIV